MGDTEAPIVEAIGFRMQFVIRTATLAIIIVTVLALTSVDLTDRHRVEPERRPAGGEIAIDDLWVSKSIGLVEAGTTKQIEFEIPNDTESACRIERVEISCRCIVARDNPTYLPARSHVKWVLTLKAPLKSMELSQHVLLHTDTGRVIHLSLNCSVRRVLSFNKEEFSLGESNDSSNRRGSLTLVGYHTAGSAITHVNVVECPDWLNVSITKVPVAHDSEAANQWRLDYECDEKLLKFTGKFRGRLAVATPTGVIASCVINGARPLVHRITPTHLSFRDETSHQLDLVSSEFVNELRIVSLSDSLKEVICAGLVDGKTSILVTRLPNPTSNVPSAGFLTIEVLPIGEKRKIPIIVGVSKN
jgi:hypothetical protein